MNFLMLRSNIQNAASELQPVKETKVDASHFSKAATTLEGLFSEQTSTESTSLETHDTGSDENGGLTVPNGDSDTQVERHIDVAEDNGFLVIPYKEVPTGWTEAQDILSFRSLDRNFVFPGEQIRILVCLSAHKQDTEIITPFKIAAFMKKNGTKKSPNKQNGELGGNTGPEFHTVGTVDRGNKLRTIVTEGKVNSQKDIPSSELVRMEDHKRQTERMLQRFNNSHFLVRISESNEPLWSRRKVDENYPESSATLEEHLAVESSKNQATSKKKNSLCAAVDTGIFDAQKSGGQARGASTCCSLPNGDIVVLLQVSVGVEFIRDPILEVLQFERHEERELSLENHDTPSFNQDPSSELLKWLLPLEKSVLLPARSLSPPTLSSSSSVWSSPTKPIVSASSSSPIFSFSNFRSYSMSSLPANTTPPPVATTPDVNPMFEPEDWNQFSFKKFVKGGSGRMLSFRGVPLQPERFSVQCGLEGIFTPGRRWSRKLELIQPVEIHSFSVDCNADDLLCVSVKNVSPTHVPDLVVFVDAMTVVFEEASKGGPPSFLPIACMEPGENHSLPNLALRKGEEHSFILKPTTSFWKDSKGKSISRSSRLPAGDAAQSWHGEKHARSPEDQYSIIVSCRCNYTESKLFYKHPTNWRPRYSKELMISVASEMSLGSDRHRTQLPVQVLTLEASNRTSEDLTLTVVAPAAFTSPRSMVPLSSPLSAAAEEEIVEGSREGDVGCNHLWMQSRVPLGCVPAQSTATAKLEVLPLTDGIINLDSLQIEVKEKGVTCVAEQSLKIYATASIGSGVL